MDQMPGIPYRHYLNYSIQIGSGVEQGNWIENDSWTSEMMSLSLGAEGYRKGTSQKGRAGFVELGLTYGGITRHNYEYNGSYSADEGFGFITNLGARTWSSQLFGEVQLVYSTWIGHVFPSIAAGYRF